MKIIEVGNKEYEVRFSINTLCRMEDDGIEVMHIDQLMENVNFRLIRKLFFYGLKENYGKSLTENKAGELLDEYLKDNDYNELMMVLLGELAKSLGYDVNMNDEPEEENKTENEEAGK